MKTHIAPFILAVLLVSLNVPPQPVKMNGAENSLKILVLSTETTVSLLDAYGYCYDIKHPSALENWSPQNYSVVYVRYSGRPTSDAQRLNLLWAVGNGTGVIEDQLCDYDGNYGTHLLGINATNVGLYQSCIMIFNSTDNFIVAPVVRYINGTSLGWGMYSREAYFDYRATPLCTSRTILAYQNESTKGTLAPLLVLGEYGAGKVFFMNTHPYQYHSDYFQMLFLHRAIAYLSKDKVGVFVSPLPNGHDAALTWRWDDIGVYSWDTQAEITDFLAYYEETFSYGMSGDLCIVVAPVWRQGNYSTWDVPVVRQWLSEGKVAYELHGTIDGHVLLGEHYPNYTAQVEAVYQGAVLLSEIFGEWPLALMPPGWYEGNNASGCARACGLHYDLKYHRQPLISYSNYPTLQYYKDSPALPHNNQYFWGEMIFWDNQNSRTIFQITQTLVQQRMKYSFYIALCHPKYGIGNGGKYGTSAWNNVMNITRGVAYFLRNDDGSWWHPDMKEMLSWLYARYDAQQRILDVKYDPTAKKVTVTVSVQDQIAGLTLMLPNSLGLDVKNCTVNGKAQYFLPATHQDTARVVLPSLEAGNHTVTIFLGSPNTPRVTGCQSWHYPQILGSGYASYVLTVNVSYQQPTNLTIQCASLGRPYTVLGGSIKAYNATMGELVVHIYAGTVRVSWVYTQPTEYYTWGAIAGAGGILAYILYRRRKTA